MYSHIHHQNIIFVTLIKISLIKKVFETKNRKISMSIFLLLNPVSFFVNQIKKRRFHSPLFYLVYFHWYNKPILVHNKNGRRTDDIVFAWSPFGSDTTYPLDNHIHLFFFYKGWKMQHVNITKKFLPRRLHLLFSFLLKWMT